MNISGNIPGKFVLKVLSLLELLAFNPIQNLLHLKKFFYENLRNVWKPLTVLTTFREDYISYVILTVYFLEQIVFCKI